MGWQILEIVLKAIVKIIEGGIKLFALIIDGIEMLINVLSSKC